MTRLRIDGQTFDGADDAIRYLVGSHTKTELIELVVAQATADAAYEAAVEALERLINVGDALWEDHPPVWMSEADAARAVLARLREGEAANVR